MNEEIRNNPNEEITNSLSYLDNLIYNSVNSNNIIIKK